jgi:hypothetical protein
MGEITIIINGEFFKKNEHHFLWNGDGSRASTNGPVIKYINSILKKKYIEEGINTIFLPINSDGNTFEYTLTKHYEFLKNNDINIENYKIIVGTLAQSQESNNINYLYLPLDDFVFDNGYSYQNESYFIQWEKKIPKAFWRGECSGTCYDNNELARIRIVKELLECDLSDVKMTNQWGWANGKDIPANYFVSSRISYQEMFKYKIFMIIDGNVIASNHMWGFATHCVPIIISNAKCWFSEYLEPFVNYVPVNYDLSDLKYKIRWIIENDEKAKIIADNAFKLSQEKFSSEFQRKYLEEKLNKILI